MRLLARISSQFLHDKQLFCSALVGWPWPITIIKYYCFFFFFFCKFVCSSRHMLGGGGGGGGDGGCGGSGCDGKNVTFPAGARGGDGSAGANGEIIHVRSFSVRSFSHKTVFEVAWWSAPHYCSQNTYCEGRNFRWRKFSYFSVQNLSNGI